MQDTPERLNFVERLSRPIALAGGLLMLTLAGMVTVSVLGRWLFGQPVPGDFEFVQMATALAVFSFLPYGQARRANIIVDAFTTRLSPAFNARLEGLWDLVNAALMALISGCLVNGVREAAANGTSTMMLQLPVWPAFAVATGLAALLALVSLATGINRLWSGR